MIAATPTNLPSSRPCARAAGAEDVSIAVLSPDHDRRAEVEAFIEAAYACTFGGRISSHYPTLISIRGAEGAIQAAAGIRFADQEPLFLEQYLDEPVEVALTRTFGVPSTRAAVAEIGNLVADDHRASGRLFVQLAAYLLGQGRTLAVATATRQLRRRFRRIGLATQPLATARPERLGSGAQEWGRYYGRDPEVLAGLVRTIPPRLLAAPWTGQAEAA